MLLFSAVTILLLALVLIGFGGAEWHGHHRVHRSARLKGVSKEAVRPSRSLKRYSTSDIYRIRAHVLGQTEAALFTELRMHIPPQYLIFPKMRIADVLETAKGTGYYVHKNAVLPKHLDFVICDTSLVPVLAIELGLRSDEHPERVESEKRKRDACEAAGFTLFVIPVGTSFQRAVQDLISAYL